MTLLTSLIVVHLILNPNGDKLQVNEGKGIFLARKYKTLHTKEWKKQQHRHGIKNKKKRIKLHFISM